VAEQVIQLGNRMIADLHHEHNKKLFDGKLSYKQSRQLQHEIKMQAEKYTKDLLGKGVNYTKVVIWDDMVIIQYKGFLTEPEKTIAKTLKGSSLVKATRLQITNQIAIDSERYFEAMLGAKCLHQSFDIDTKKDLYVHILFFDKLLIKIKE
jgi:uncharacterized protein YbcI